MKKLYCIPKIDEIEQYCSFSNEFDAGFEYNDFFLPSILDDEIRTNSLINLYTHLDRDRSCDTLHGAFLDICINSDDPYIIKVSDFRIRQCMDIGRKLGVKAVIFHTNNIPYFRLDSYRKNWLNRNAAYWDKITDEYPEINIYIENMFDEAPLLLGQLASMMADNSHFGICLDFAHAFLSDTPLEAWSGTLKPFTRHLHINDNDRYQDLHAPVGSCRFPWEFYRQFIDSFSEPEKPSVLIEVSGYDKLIKSVEYMQKNHLYPL